MCLDPTRVCLNARVDWQSKVSGAEFAFRVDQLNEDGVWCVRCDWMLL